ncbi:MAG: hypothetical protein IJW21_03245 [Clostridia bacterium]|nr:hypothetical protein [Clostridia bacterium]
MKSHPILPYLTNIKEYSGFNKETLKNEPCAIEATLACSCGSNKFKIIHTGKQTKGILAPLIINKEKQLRVTAVCPECPNRIEIYNSSEDNYTNDFSDFSFSNISVWQIKLMYNYFPQKMKIEGNYSASFKDVFIDIFTENHKPKRLIEQ